MRAWGPWWPSLILMYLLKGERPRAELLVPGAHHPSAAITSVLAGIPTVVGDGRGLVSEGKLAAASGGRGMGTGQAKPRGTYLDLLANCCCFPGPIPPHPAALLPREMVRRQFAQTAMEHFSKDK